MKPKKYHGVVPPIMTPIDANEDVDEKGFRQLIEYNIQGGIHGLFVAGTNGDTMALTQRERNRAISIALEQVNGRIPVMAGVMDTSTRRVIENIHALEDMGGTCAVVTSVFYDRHTSQEETVRHFERILSETDVDLFIYNIPPFTGLRLNADTVIKIARLDKRVVGYKDSSGAFGEFLQVLAEFRETPFSVLQGLTAIAMPSILYGADGYVPGLAVAFPEIFVEAYDAAASGNIELTIQYDAILRKTSQLLKMTKNGTAATKYVASLLGFTDKRVIAPQDFMSPEEEAMVRQGVEEVKRMHAELKAR